MIIGWEDAKESIEEDDRGKHDLLVKPEAIRWVVSREEFMASFDGSGHLYLSPWAESQLCNWLGIPVKYFRECPGELKRLQVEFLIKNRLSSKGKWRLRLRNKTIRAFLSDHYQPFDNKKVMSLWESVGNPGRFDYELMLDDTFFLLRGMVRIEPGKDGDLDGLLAGLFIRNSEVGRSALAVGASVYRLICKNGLVEYLDEKPPLYQRHIWIDEAELARKLERALPGALTIAEWSLERMSKAREIPTNLSQLLEKLDRLNLTEDTQQAIIDLFVSEGDSTASGMVNAISATARDLPPYERHRLESQAWRLLTSVTQS